MGNEDGVWVDGNKNTIISNTIANAINVSNGVTINSGTCITISRNSIYGNTAIGIDLGDYGFTISNDSQGHVGPNNYQNFPQIDTAISSSGLLTFSGVLASTPGTYTLDFYTSPQADKSGYGQGKTWVGSMTVTVDSNSGSVAFNNVSFSDAVPSDQVVSATATDAAGNTSEFSLAVTIEPGMAGPTPDQTSTTLISSANPSTYGQSVTLTASVTDLVNSDTSP